jgi:hypothetical protein
VSLGEGLRKVDIGGVPGGVPRRMVKEEWVSGFSGVFLGERLKKSGYRGSSGGGVPRGIG